MNHLTQLAPDAYDTLARFRGDEPADPRPAALRGGLGGGARTARRTRSAPTTRRTAGPPSSGPGPRCAAGLTGVQTLVPIMLDHVNAGRLSLARMVDLMCAGPARVYGVVGKGRLAAGYDADFTLVDLKRRRTIEDSWIVSPCGWTPFAGMPVTGWPVATIVRGQPVMREDEVLGEPLGKLVTFRG